MSTTQLLLLGPFRFSRNGQVVQFSIAKMQALLAYLAVTGAPQSREHLLDLLWTESHPDAARKNLRNSLWRLRQQLGEDVVSADEDRLMLSGTVWTDVVAFESELNEQLASDQVRGDKLQPVLELWRGDLLAGLRLSDAPDFELWLNGERQRLGQLYLRSLDQLLAGHRAAARWNEMVTVAQRALAYDNTQEAMHAAAMEAYARLGRRTDALRQYDTLRNVLEKELNVAPLPDTQALRVKILGGALAAEERPLPTSSPVFKPTPRPRPIRPFVGRQMERDRLDEALHLAAGGHMRIALLSGELGIGKSTLWQHWSAALPAEAAILEARCLESTQALPFAPLTGLFGTQANLARIAGDQSPISALWLAELSRLLPQIRDIRPDLHDVSPLPPQEERRRLFEAFVQILQALAATPLVLFVDDLHWADQATLDWLVYVADRMHEEPLLVVGAYRSHEASTTLEHYVARWNREQIVVRLSLSPLSADEATALVAALDGNVEMVDYLHTQSGGNPYYLTELSRVHPDGMPAALVDLLRARLRGLPEGARRTLQAAAILEPTISYDMLQRISRQNEDETLDALDLLLEMAVLTERGEAYEFAHPLLADIVRDGLSTPRRRRLHLRAAQAFGDIHAGDLAAIAGQLTRHYAEAGHRSEAARYADTAATQATQMGAMIEAANFCRQAYALEPTPSRQAELGYALMHVPGGLREARAALQQAFADSEARLDQKGIVQAGLRLALSYLSTEQGEQVLYWAERIRAAAHGSDDTDLLATVEYLMAAGKFNSQHAMVEADAHYREATRLATEHSLISDIAIQSWFGWGNLSVQLGDFAAAQAKFERTLAIAHAASNIYFEALSYNNLAYAALLAGDLAVAQQAITTGLDFVDANQLMRPRQYLYSTRGEVALAEGDLDAAESWFNRAIEEAHTYDNNNHAINVRAHHGRVAQARGELARALTLFSDAHDALPAGSALHLHIQIELWLAALYLECDNRPEALTILAAAQEKLAGSPRRALQAQAEALAAAVG